LTGEHQEALRYRGGPGMWARRHNRNCIELSNWVVALHFIFWKNLVTIQQTPRSEQHSPPWLIAEKLGTLSVLGGNEEVFEQGKDVLTEVS